MSGEEWVQTFDYVLTPANLMVSYYHKSTSAFLLFLPLSDGLYPDMSSCAGYSDLLYLFFGTAI